MQTVTAGSKKKVYKSIREASEALSIPYMTLYMRMRKGDGGLMWSVSKAMKKPVRKYNKKLDNSSATV